MSKLTIVIAPADGSGHFNACIGIGQILLNRGHRVVFIAKRSSWEGKLKPLGFEEELYEDIDEIDRKTDKVNWTQSVITNITPYLKESPIDHHKGYGRMKWTLLSNKAMKENSIYAQIVNRVKPNVILIDNLCVSPSLITAGIPWIRTVSSQVLFAIDDERTPPTGSGLSSIHLFTFLCFRYFIETYLSTGYAMNSSKNLWQKYRQFCNELYEDIWNQLNQYMISEGAQSLPRLKFMPTSPFANFYMYPKEIDYIDIRPLPPKWHQFDNFIRSDCNQCEDFDLPKNFIEKPGKLIYFSLGSIACADLDLLKKLINILSKSPNKFIISKGPFDQQLILSDNMWGEEYVSQVKVLKLVDLVITHGGNNTITELFYFGKPLIVLPIFSDQFDNAQRVQEMGYGLSLNAYHCEEEELLRAIETILADNNLIKRINDAGIRIRSEQSENSIRLAKLVESIAQ
jgi:UDP:flavonoid glycosyltransferase YjiC (YdhE family)